jgi:hypothetical protein
LFYVEISRELLIECIKDLINQENLPDHAPLMGSYGRLLV